MEKRPFVTKGQLEEIVKEYPTPFHLYDEKGIRENAKALKEENIFNLYYRKFCLKATKSFSSKTDVYSIYATTILSWHLR